MTPWMFLAIWIVVYPAGCVLGYLCWSWYERRQEARALRRWVALLHTQHVPRP